MNAATLKTHGIDAEMNYGMQALGGNVSVRGLLSYQPKNVLVNFQGSTPLNRAGAAGLPAYRATAFLHYDVDAFSIDMLQRWHSSTRRSSDPTQIFDAPRVGARAYTDVTLSYRLKTTAIGTAQFFVTVQNLFDRAPAPFVNTGAASTVPGFFVPVTNGDDPIGRYFTAGVRIRL